MSYKNLEIWRLAREVVIDIHKMTLKELPKFEIFEESSQIRKSSKSIKSTDHLETLFETGSLVDKEIYNSIHDKLEILGKKLNLFIQSVEKGHISEK